MAESDWVTIPEADVLQHVFYDAHGHIPFGWHVFMLKDLEALQKVRQQYGIKEAPAYAFTHMSTAPDDANSIGTIYLCAGWVYVGLVAHESLHLASWMCRFPPGQWPTQGRQQTRVARMTMGHEPELLAEIVGQLTSVIWYNLERDGFTDVDE